MARGVVDRARPCARRARHFAVAAVGKRGGACAQQAHRRGACECRVPDRQALDRMAALMAGASFVIGVDTGLIHLAAALGVPLVAIFTGSEAGLTGPMGTGPIVGVGGKHKQASVPDGLGGFEQLASALDADGFGTTRGSDRRAAGAAAMICRTDVAT